MNDELVDGEFYWIKLYGTNIIIAQYNAKHSPEHVDTWWICGSSCIYFSENVEVISYVSRPQ